MERQVSQKIIELSERAQQDLRARFEEIDKVAFLNTEKVLSAFQRGRVSDGCFAGTTGYGYDDKGREILDGIYADIFRTEAALVRIGFVNGTHAITAALIAALKPGDTLMSATGVPYDTLQSAIGLTGEHPGSLAYYGIGYDQADFLPDGKPDVSAIAAKAARKNVGAVFVQRSGGYSARAALTVEEIGEIVAAVRRVNKGAAVIVDNCYGEFRCLSEPSEGGGDVVAGSLIKNPGGGLARTGGYIAGRADLVEAAAFRLTSPGIGGECGSTLGQNRLLYQGLFMAPHTVAQALKTAAFCARLMELLGYETFPDAARRAPTLFRRCALAAPRPKALLPRDPGRRARRRFCDAGALGHAWL
jgi:cystathionine beta-lyase family protein involved in aluminum resistance